MSGQHSKPRDIVVTVTGTPSSPVFSSPSPRVQSNGNVNLAPGATSVKFVTGSGVSWTLTGISIQPSPNPFETKRDTGGVVRIHDKNPGGQAQTFTYTLGTTDGDFDPALINKGGSG